MAGIQSDSRTGGKKAPARGKKAPARSKVQSKPLRAHAAKSGVAGRKELHRASHKSRHDGVEERFGAASQNEGGSVSSKFHFSEVHGDLFSCPEKASLAHCVSADLHMSKGIAAVFKQRFGGVEELEEQGIFNTEYCSFIAYTHAVRNRQ